jgi:hypothetical protein
VAFLPQRIQPLTVEAFSPQANGFLLGASLGGFNWMLVLMKTAREPPL